MKEQLDSYIRRTIRELNDSRPARPPGDNIRTLEIYDEALFEWYDIVDGALAEMDRRLEEIRGTDCPGRET